MAQKILAMTAEGKLTYCTASPEERGKGRCNHIAHKKDDQEVSDFINENSVHGKIVPYRMSIMEKAKLMPITCRKDLADPDCTEGGYIEVETPVWSIANVKEFAERIGKPSSWVRGVIDGKKEISGYGTGVTALNAYAADNGYEATTDIYVLPYNYREDVGDVKNPLNGLYNYICTAKTPEKRQEGYDRLLDNENVKNKYGIAPAAVRGIPVQSLGGKFTGKHGIIRGEMTGYSVGFTSHMVISPCAGLKSKEVGAPPHMCAELYSEEIYTHLVQKHGISPSRARDYVNAMKDPNREPSQEEIDTLDRIMVETKSKCLMNRAPSLHTSSIGGFYLRVNGTSNITYNSLGQKGVHIPRSRSTYMLCPSVCAGFNADFDGDSMGLTKVDNSRISDEDFVRTYTTESVLHANNPSHLDSSAMKPTKDSMFGLLNLLMN